MSTSRIPAVVENTENTRLVHYNREGREVPIPWNRRNNARTSTANNVTRRNRRRNMPAVVENATPVIYTPGFGKLDIEHELETLNLDRFGRLESDRIKRNFLTMIKAVQIFFKKVYFIHIIFNITKANRPPMTSMDAVYISPYIEELIFVDNYGNMYKPFLIPFSLFRDAPGNVVVPDVPGENRVYIRTLDGNTVNEDSIVSSGVPLSDTQVTFVKSIPTLLGDAFGESCISMIQEMAPHLKTLAKETSSLVRR
jgi:hypothetical protein